MLGFYSQETNLNPMEALKNKSRSLRIEVERFPIAGKFTIARGGKTEAVVVTVTLTQASNAGRGECVPYSRYGESIDSVVESLEKIRGKIEAGASRLELQGLLAPGAARNALDCAMWDLEAKTSKIGVTELMKVKVRPVVTAYTISLGTADEMAQATRLAANRPLLKIKFGGPNGDIERIRAVRAAAPHATLIADANEGWTIDNLKSHLEQCAISKFSLIEQPLPAKNDEQMRGIVHSVPICADESVHGIDSLDRLVGLYDFVNIKLDKTGGLTEAIKLVKTARQKKFGIMIGCMVGSSLGMAPALTLAGEAEFVDLDGPLLLSKDRENGLRYDGSVVYPPSPNLWG